MSDVAIINYNFDVNKLLTEAIEFRKKYGNEKTEQLCVTGTAPESNHNEGSGSLIYNWNGLTRTLKEKQNTEDQYIHFLNMFKGTYTEDVYNKLSMTYKIGRLRFMYVKPKTCYTWHKDSTHRIHIPLYTDHTQTGLIIEDTIIRMPADGNAYIVDTRKPHTAFNGWLETRIHLVGVLM